MPRKIPHRWTSAGAAVLSLSLLTTAFITTAGAATPARDQAAIDRLVADSGGAVEISLNRATGVARFVRLQDGQLSMGVVPSATPQERATAFLRDYGSIFGVTAPAAELRLAESRTDRLGSTRLTYDQVYRGVPVYAGLLRFHFDDGGNLKAVNGNFVPGIDVAPTPVRSAADAAAIALAKVAEEAAPQGPALTVRSDELTVFRSGLLRGVSGQSYLTWKVEVGNGVDVREFVFVDARTGKVVEQITGIHEAIHRTIYDVTFPTAVIWDEGDPLPFASSPPDPNKDPQINGMIDFAEDVYDMYLNMSGGTYASWDGADGVMHSVFNAPISCPNATWNGTSTNYCDGVTGDDTVAHEWTHAYTDGTHDLIYQWQSGALNESYSDIFGEVVDIINGAGTDSPDVARSAGGCSTLGGSPPPTFTVNSPGSIAGEYPAGGANFNPAPPATATANVELVDDDDDGAGAGTVTDGCEPFVGFTAGRIALVDRGFCGFVVKVQNAEDAGAVGLIVANNQGDGVIQMGGTGPFTIPSVMVGQSNGDLLKTTLTGSAVNATIELATSSDNSIRWLSGEDDPSFGGAIRDMWNPTCFGDPGKVSDLAQYACGTADSGGVHTNSGIPNHAFALLVDGGTYNGETVAAIGLTKAAHVYWQAMSVYQTPVTDLPDHADALEQSCADLLGVNLTDLTTGAPSGQMINAGDCSAVADAMAAVEMREDPTFCGFTPLLDPFAPPLSCVETVFFDDFETDPSITWTLSNFGVNAEYTPRDWEWTADVPDGGTGMAFFGIDSVDIGDCIVGSDDQSGVMHLDSPDILLPAGAADPILTFDHWVSTELGFDGGNVKISVNGGPFQLIAGADFHFNPYNAPLTTAGGGNTNPMAGEDAFNGTDGGSNSGSWGQSQIDLSNYAGPGDTITLRFDLGVDGCNGSVGWYVDNVLLCGDGDFALFADGFESGDLSRWSSNNQ